MIDAIQLLLIAAAFATVGTLCYHEGVSAGQHTGYLAGYKEGMDDMARTNPTTEGN